MATYQRFWKLDEQRKMIEEAWNTGADNSWVSEQLLLLETRITSDIYKTERTDQCLQQARFWLKIDQPERAAASLQEAFRQSIGINGEKDEQLVTFVYWLNTIYPVDRKK